VREGVASKISHEIPEWLCEQALADPRWSTFDWRRHNVCHRYVCCHSFLARSGLTLLCCCRRSLAPVREQLAELQKRGRAKAAQPDIAAAIPTLRDGMDELRYRTLSYGWPGVLKKTV